MPYVANDSGAILVAVATALIKGKASSSKDGAKPPEAAPSGDETDDDYFDIIEELR